MKIDYDVLFGTCESTYSVNFFDWLINEMESGYTTLAELQIEYEDKKEEFIDGSALTSKEALANWLKEKDADLYMTEIIVDKAVSFGYGYDIFEHIDLARSKLIRDCLNRELYEFKDFLKLLNLVSHTIGYVNRGLNGIEIISLNEYEVIYRYMDDVFFDPMNTNDFYSFELGEFIKLDEILAVDLF